MRRCQGHRRGGQPGSNVRCRRLVPAVPRQGRSIDTVAMLLTSRSSHAPLLLSLDARRGKCPAPAARPQLPSHRSSRTNPLSRPCQLSSTGSQESSVVSRPRRQRTRCSPPPARRPRAAARRLAARQVHRAPSSATQLLCRRNYTSRRRATRGTARSGRDADAETEHPHTLQRERKHEKGTKIGKRKNLKRESRSTNPHHPAAARSSSTGRFGAM